MNYSFMNYACYYKYRINNISRNLGFNNDRNQACFSDMYYEIRRDEHIKSITLKIKTTPEDLERNRNNYLILTDEEFKVWKRLVAKLCGVKITSVNKEKIGIDLGGKADLEKYKNQIVPEQITIDILGNYDIIDDKNYQNIHNGGVTQDIKTQRKSCCSCC